MLGRTFRSSVLCVLAASALSLVFLATGCGSANFNRIFVSKAETDAMGSILERARYQYDQGNFDDALDLAEKALAINPNNEDAVVLAGYIYLSKAGVDPFQLAKKLIEIGDTNKTATGTALADASSSDNSTATVLNQLTSLVGLTSADKANLQWKMDPTDPSIPVPLPSCSEEARAKINALQYVNKAIALVCPFVDASVRLSNETRHTCKATDVVRKVPAKAHFLWAFSHLTEALTFNLVLLYSTDTAKDAKGQVTTNMQRRITSLDGKTVGVDKLIAVVNQIKEVQKEVFPVEKTDHCSTANQTPQFWATLNDMSSVTKAFDAISGMPASITAPITKAMSEIDKIGKSVSDKSSAFTQQTQNLKSQMNKKLGKTIGDKISELKTAAGGTLPAEKMTELCGTYDQITEYGKMAEADKKDAGRPADCP